MNKILSQALKKAVSEYSPEVKEVSKGNRPDLFSLNNETELFQNETGNTRASRKDFADSADFIGWYASKGYYQGFEKTDARSLYLAYHEGYGGFEKKTYRKKQWLIKVADRVQARSTKYQKQYWGCAKELKRKKFIFF